MHPTLTRLDDLAASLAARGDIVAVLGLGSAGAEHDRFDEHSDIDFFVVTDEHRARRYIDDIGWLAAMGRVLYCFSNERNGRKALFADGLLVEYAVFTAAELAQLPFAGARVIWARPDQPHEPLTSNLAPPAPPFDTVQFHLNEALTNLFVGLHRELRGERLTAMRFIQVYAVDRLANLLRLTDPAPHRRDPFEPTRRLESTWPPEALPLAELAPGYSRNADAARATLSWLIARFDADPALVHAIRKLLASLAEPRP